MSELARVLRMAAKTQEDVNCMATAALFLEAAAEIDALKDRIVGLSVLADGWMSAHDRLKAGSPYKFPKPVDLTDMQKDAARYRWLRDANHVQQETVGECIKRMKFSAVEQLIDRSIELASSVPAGIAP